MSLTKRRAVLALIFGAALTSCAPVVAVDVGHTLTSPGALSARGIPEIDFNRTLATNITTALEGAGLRTEIINADGKISSLQARVEQARNATLLLSVHHDSVQESFLQEWTYNGQSRLHSEGMSGFSLFVARSNRHFQQSLSCASAIGRALKSHGFEPSTYHSATVPGENHAYADEENGVYYGDELIVLKTAQSASVLLEAGVIVDIVEEENLSRQGTRELMANAVAEGILSCLPRTHI